MMPKWHHLDSSRARFAKQDSVKKKTLELNSRSSLNSALFYRTITSKYEEDLIKIEGARVATTQNNDFSNTQGQLTP